MRATVERLENTSSVQNIYQTNKDIKWDRYPQTVKNVPDDYMGDVIGNLSGKRGKIEGTTKRGNATVINSKVPLAEMFGYATELRGMTQGRGNFTMEPSHYEEVPSNITQEIIEGSKS